MKARLAALSAGLDELGCEALLVLAPSAQDSGPRALPAGSGPPRGVPAGAPSWGRAAPGLPDAHGARGGGGNRPRPADARGSGRLPLGERAARSRRSSLPAWSARPWSLRRPARPRRPGRPWPGRGDPGRLRFPGRGGLDLGAGQRPGLRCAQAQGAGGGGRHPRGRRPARPTPSAPWPACWPRRSSGRTATCGWGASACASPACAPRSAGCSRTGAWSSRGATSSLRRRREAIPHSSGNAGARAPGRRVAGGGSLPPWPPVRGLHPHLLRRASRPSPWRGPSPPCARPSKRPTCAPGRACAAGTSRRPSCTRFTAAGYPTPISDARHHRRLRPQPRPRRGLRPPRVPYLQEGHRRRGRAPRRGRLHPRARPLRSRRKATACGWRISSISGRTAPRCLTPLPYDLDPRAW